MLDLFTFFPTALEAVAEAEWQRNSDPVSRVQILRPLLRHATDVASFVEDWLTHTGTSAVPVYLLKAVERSSEAMGLGERQAVIANGPADNFTTVVGDIEDILFRKLGPLCPPVPSSLSGTTFALMRAPRLEGTGAIWHPILLGHEIAHIAVKVHGAVPLVGLHTKFDFSQASLLDVPGSSHPGPAGALRLYEIAESWAEELICDAFAARAFGASAVASLSEYLETIAATDLLSDTHPPGRLRNYLLVQWVGQVVDARLEAVVAPWRQLADQPVAYPQPWAQFLVDIFLNAAEELLAAAHAWEWDDFDVNTRSPIITELADMMRAGIPGEVTMQTGGTRHQVGDADVIAAAWIGRVESFESPTAILARKALDNLEFMREWGIAGGAWPVPQTFTPTSDNESSTLSASELTSRIYGSGPRQMVVTPLLPDFSSGASLDLRLGNTFIVFVRSRTSSFDPLDEDQDPRQVQQRMELAWGDTFVLHPAELVLASTLEYLVLPADLTAQVVSRSSYGRLGLLSATAIQVHPHFHGCLTLELVNLGTVPLILTPGERIAQLVVSPITPAAPPVNTKYHCAIEPEFSKVRTDDEASVLRELR